MQDRINAILSDYDGTLSPTKTLRNNEESVPKQLEEVLCNIAQSLPVCIVSSKDYHFLNRKAKFARVLSCIMGIETVVLKMLKDTSSKIEIRSNNGDNLGCIKERYLLPNIEEILSTNSATLSKLAKSIESEFKANVIVERKYTSDRKYLAGITIDYRHLENWELYKNKLEPSLNEVIQKYSSLSQARSNLYTQMYRSHPFLDVYSVYSDKGNAFDLIANNILNFKNNNEEIGRQRGILYLGDSENDNPAFRKASISVGIISDKRLNPKLDCQYMIEFNDLFIFLKNLLKAKFVFSEDLLVK